MALVTVQTNPTRQLSSAAASSYRRMLTDGLPAGGINSAYRSTASQEAIFFARYKVQWVGRGPYGDVKWYKGKRYVRQSGLPVAVPGTSAHNKGTAIDVSVGSDAGNWVMKYGPRHGWNRPIPSSDPVHWEYTASKDVDLKNQTAARKKMKSAQKAIRVPTSGVPDATTRKAASAVRGANQNPPKFPYGKSYAQTHSGTKADGVWGPKSRAANTKTVKSFQSALGVKADGDWGPKTDAAWAAVQKDAK